MFRIAIVDDDNAHNHTIQEMLDQRYPFQFRTDVYTNGSALVHDLEHGLKSFDIIILDIKMPWLDGISAGKRIRDLGIDAKIILLTQYSEYMPDGYDIQASNFIIKPVPKDRFFSTIDRAIYEVERSAFQRSIAVTTRAAVKVVPIHEIMYIESEKRKSCIYRISGDKYICYKQIYQYEQELGDFHFVKSHHSYLVNLRYVSQIEVKEMRVYLCDGKCAVPISRKYKDQFLGALHNRINGN